MMRSIKCDENVKKKVHVVKAKELSLPDSCD